MFKLSDKQVAQALLWKQQHINAVKAKASSTTSCYPPTDIEDINNPALWKGAHWNWFNKTQEH